MSPLALFFLLAAAPSPSVDARIDALLRQMTMQEKLGQLTQFVPDQPEFAPALEKGLVGSILNSGGAAQVNEIQRRAIAGSRLKIPLLIGHDVIHGYRTIFPIPLAIAATWDPELAELSARIAAREARAAGIRWTFAPMVDIARDPRWGRIAEGAGEDPHLGAAMAAAYVRGFQSEGLLACAKHYAAYGAPLGGRDYGEVELSEQTLREVYLPPFHAAVDAGAASLMSAFNTINGVPSSANRRLLHDVLREEWGFRGFVVSDWSAVQELMHHGIAATKADAAAAAITAGVDMAMVDATYTELGGRVPEAVIDRAVRRVLKAKFDAGLFDDPFTDEQRAAAVTLTPEARAAARRVAQKAIVLLKNDKALLPLKRDAKVAVVGSLADAKADMLGTWAAQGKPEEAVSLAVALRVVPLEEADVVVAAMGESREISGEAASRASLDLARDDQALLERVVASGKPVVLVVMSGRPLSISWAAEHVPAILQAWHLGTEAGNAIADVLFGDVNPSGKLPVTIPRHVGQVPIHYSQLPTGRPADAANKFTNKYVDVPIGPLYPFGHGLSYTKFEYSDLQVSATKASVVVRNAGDRAGEEVVQLYISDPVASVSRPVKELKGFRRIALQPGESRRVEFAITTESLRFWGPKGWTVEPGKFVVRIGGLEGSTSR